MNTLNQRSLLICASLALAAASSAITISEARTLPLGSIVTINSAYLSGKTAQLGAPTFTVQDSRDYFGWQGALISNVVSGSSFAQFDYAVSITGTTARINGMFNITDASVGVISTGNERPVPVQVYAHIFRAGMNFSGEQYEGARVAVQQVSFLESGTFADGGIYHVTDGSNVLEVKVFADTPLLGSAIPTGWINLNGAMLQNDMGVGGDAGGYYVVPDSHVAAVPEPASLAALGVGAIALLRRRRR